MVNKDVFAKDPTSYTLPNDGVAKVAEPQTPAEWEVARYEVEHFVCEGSYHEGLRRILESYLTNLAQPVQRAVWVHGFYGCGKSHLVRILDFLWRDVTFPDRATARGMAHLPADVLDALKELTNAGRQRGGLWSAAGTLGSGSAQDPRAALLGIVLRAAGLPERINHAQFDLWVRREGWHEQIQAGLKAQGRSYTREVNNLLVSTALATELLKANPSLASSPGEALKLIKEQFPRVSSVTNEDLTRVMGDVFTLVSNKPGTIPCVLLVVDELQQYLGDNTDRSDSVREAVEACVARFGSSLLFVATGQSAIQATPVLQRLQGRFTVPIFLQEKDVEQVLRQTVLLKSPAALPRLEQTLDGAQGEIARHLGGSQIGAQPTDPAILPADYPLLPTRRRFWERVLRAVDRGGSAAQLRTQLRLAHEAARAVGRDPLGCVVGADFIFDQQKATLLQTAVLLPDVNRIIEELQGDGKDGPLKARLCALLFLIKELDPSVGVRATPETLADLLVTDLPAGSVDLRHKVPELLRQLVESGKITPVGDEYRVQTREGAEWDGKYRSRLASIKGDDARISVEREKELRAAVEGLVGLRSLNLAQGDSKAPRTAELHFGADQPDIGVRIPIWVRSGWDVAEGTVRGDAANAGTDSPLVFVFLPRMDADALRAEIAGRLAAQDVLDTEPTPTTEEGRAARASVEARLENHRQEIASILSRVLDEAKVLQGGGVEVTGMDLRAAVERAAQNATLRLYRRFPDADHKNWHTVAERARQGAPDALQAVGHTGDALQHPVCHAVRSFVGAAGKTGTEVRRNFEAPPYGWPRDAVDAALLVLVQAASLSARKATRQIPLAELTSTAVQQTEFRAETTVITTLERLAIRKLLADAKEQYTQGDEAVAVRGLLQRMEQLASEAGGEPPRPERPSVAYLLDLKALGGNELLAEVYGRQDQLARDRADWSSRRDRIKQRLPRWEWLQRLLTLAKGLPEYPNLQVEVQAILSQRSLLADPDPVPDLVTKAAHALRTALQAAFDRYQQTHHAKVEELNQNPTWQALPTAERPRLRERHGLQPLPPLQVQTPEDLVTELSTTSLAAWADKTNALTEQVNRALQEATAIVHPERLEYEAPYRIITSAADLDGYLDEIRQEVLARLKKAKTVVLK